MTQPRDTFGPYELITAEAMTADFVTKPYFVAPWDHGSLQLVWSGATVPLTGKATLIPQASVDGINWCNLVSSSSAKTVDEVSACQLYMLQFFGYPWFRFKFTKNSESTGTLTAYLYVTRSHGRNI
jgi:hypothetical protein